ncbi:histidine phosphatase family protein [Propionibacterium freudenreichii]|uniref:histidine phosphatase family protein n=1 Tax=Propionibacterium freudenreichii TaxID=1744 RepID=UPI0021A837BA|nr:histidine phosphatase family protein [Propionibacterium freudenreichii]MCT2977866.1 histidine phosphatase family protein [Propionibacterium freudenreichii]MCT2984804.1 histidine phosphatase family protein [Propionibacterium freudenreichii]MCT2986260.1 histidine phosphatase family protein [Propionibacterium freudenreichii]
MLDRGIDFALVRHGESTGNIGGRVLGHELGPELTTLGRTQARGAAHGLTRWHADMLWSSDMVRARSTAQEIARTTRLPLNCTALLREQDHGAMDGLPVGDLVAQPTPAGREITEVRWGGGESIADVYARLRVFVMMVAARGARRVVVVGHGDMACAFTSMLAGLGHRDVAWDRLAHGQVRYLGWDGRALLPS